MNYKDVLDDFIKKVLPNDKSSDYYFKLIISSCLSGELHIEKFYFWTGW